MAKSYRSIPVTCKDSSVSVSVDPNNWDGIVILEGVRTDYNGEGTKVSVDLEIDAAAIDTLIGFLQQAKRNSLMR